MTNKNDRRIAVRAVRRDPPDLRKLARAAIKLALEQAQVEAEAQAEHEDRKKSGGPRRAA